MDEIKDWRTSMASTLDIMRNLSRIMFEFQADLNALKAVLAESDPQFEERFAKHREEAEAALGRRTHGHLAATRKDRRQTPQRPLLERLNP